MAKKKAGQQKVNSVKSSNFLPSVFQTELNKGWLDSTLDQMVSKGPLEDIHGYIGSKNGNISLASDDYLETQETKNQLKPAVVSYNKQKKLTNAITFDDIANSINTNFSTYNYDAAYSSNRYTFNPPINIDKFVNYTNYRWVPELPVYESIWTGASKNPNFWASGISVVMHMNNPYIPAIHFNTRFIYTTHGWFGGGMDVTPCITDNKEKTLLHKELKSIISELPNKFHNPFQMLLDGYKYQEISETLDVPIGTIKSRIHYARQKIKKRLSIIYDVNMRN